MNLLLFFLILSPWNEYWEVRNIYNEANFADARDGFRRLLKKHPDTDIVPYCMFYIANLTVDPQEAIAYYRDIVELYPRSRVADNALMRIASYHYIIGEYLRADSIFAIITVEYPDGDCAKEANRWRDIIRQFETKLIFAIQIGAFTQKENAEGLAILHQNANIVFDGLLYKVRIGRFRTREDAVKFREESKIDGFIVKLD
ncbi:tetratricopeptide repeat protein [candidate division WOR-3 bacterium]|nr:tetratricopeptide repeat protein [candidate division WOR-3 bacterium]